MANAMTSTGESLTVHVETKITTSRNRVGCVNVLLHCSIFYMLNGSFLLSETV